LGLESCDVSALQAQDKIKGQSRQILFEGLPPQTQDLHGFFRPLKIFMEGVPKILRSIKNPVQKIFLAIMLMFVYGCHFGEERLQIPTGASVLPTDIPNSVMGSDEVLTLPKDIRIERFGDDSNGLWRFTYPDGTVKHKDQNGKDVVVHGGII
jgi:hypothetical protein